MRNVRTIFVLLLALSFTACVERRLLIVSDVESTPVEFYLDGEPIGESPQVVIFENYGPRDWRARADGYESASGRVELEIPWYQYPIIDFFAEVLWPATIIDEHHVSVKMHPLEVRDEAELIKRAEAFRKEAIAEANKPKTIGDKRTLKPIPEEE